MPRVMRCRQFQRNDRSKGIGFMWTLVGEDDAVSPSKSHLAEGNHDACAFNGFDDDQCGRQHDQLATHRCLRNHRT